MSAFCHTFSTCNKHVFGCDAHRTRKHQIFYSIMRAHMTTFLIDLFLFFYFLGFFHFFCFWLNLISKSDIDLQLDILLFLSFSTTFRYNKYIQCCPNMIRRLLWRAACVWQQCFNRNKLFKSGVYITCVYGSLNRQPQNHIKAQLQACKPNRCLLVDVRFLMLSVHKIPFAKMQPPIEKAVRLPDPAPISLQTGLLCKAKLI